MLYSYFVQGIPLSKVLDNASDFYNIIFSALVSFLIGAITYPFYAGNLGHIILKLKVIDTKTGNETKDFLWGGLRELSKDLMSNILIPVIWLFFDKKHQNYSTKAKLFGSKQKVSMSSIQTYIIFLF